MSFVHQNSMTFLGVIMTKTFTTLRHGSTMPLQTIHLVMAPRADEDLQPTRLRDLEVESSGSDGSHNIRAGPLRAIDANKPMPPPTGARKREQASDLNSAPPPPPPPAATAAGEQAAAPPSHGNEENIPPPPPPPPAVAAAAELLHGEHKEEEHEEHDEEVEEEEEGEHQGPPPPSGGSSGRRHGMLTRSLAGHSETPAAAPGSAIAAAASDSPHDSFPAKRLYSALSKEAGNSSLLAAAGGATRGRALDPASRKLALGTMGPAVVETGAKRRKLHEGHLKQQLQGSSRAGTAQALAAWHAILNPRGPVLPARSNAPLTVPHELHFHTDLRPRAAHGMALRSRIKPFESVAEKVRRFQNKTPTRYHSVAPGKNHPVLAEPAEMRLTHPQEPVLHTVNRSQAEMEEEELASVPPFRAQPFNKKMLPAGSSCGPGLAGPASPMMEEKPSGVPPPQKLPLTMPQVFHFECAERASKHPALPAPEDARVTSKAKKSMSAGATLTLTRPQEIHLETCQRARPTKSGHVPCLAAAAAAMVMAIAQLQSFVQCPTLPEEVMESHGELGVPRVPKRPITEPLAFNLETDKRAQSRQSQGSMDSLDASKRQVAPAALPSLITPSQSCRPSPYLQAPFWAEAYPHPHLVTSPDQLGTFQHRDWLWLFSMFLHLHLHLHLVPPGLHERGAEKERKMQEQLAAEQQRQVAASVPMAQPLPDTTVRQQRLRKPQVAPPTQPRPFDLESVKRHEEEVQRLERERQQQAQLEAAQRNFVAGPNLAKVPPFKPAESRKPLTRIEISDLNTDVRAVTRSEFNKQLEVKSGMMEQYRAEAEASKKSEEVKNIRKLRRSMVPHATALPSFDNPFKPQRSQRPLTRAMSPALGKRATRRAAATARRSMSQMR
eukprot:jgi/Mesen1/9817/ME000007S09889